MVLVYRKTKEVWDLAGNHMTCCAASKSSGQGIGQID